MTAKTEHRMIFNLTKFKRWVISPATCVQSQDFKCRAVTSTEPVNRAWIFRFGKLTTWHEHNINTDLPYSPIKAIYVRIHGILEKSSRWAYFFTQNLNFRLLAENIHQDIHSILALLGLENSFYVL